MANHSIVDYMKAHKMVASYGNRSKLAKGYGIKNYKGTANQNIQLLGKVSQSYKKAHSKPPTAHKAPKPVTHVKAPVRKPVPKKLTPSKNTLNWYNQYSQRRAKGQVNDKYDKQYDSLAKKYGLKRTIRKGDKDWFNKYTSHLSTGVNDVAHNQHYMNLAKQYGLKTGKIGNSYLQKYSIAALNGDKKAISYLKGMHYNSLKGQNLWKGIDPNKLGKSKAEKQYRMDNIYSSYTKAHDIKYLNRDSQWLMNGTNGMNKNDIAWYQKMAKRWHMDDATDPLVQNKMRLMQDKQKAMDAQDIALNQSMATMDKNNFQQMQNLKQSMSNRGIGDSGIASDQYMRAQMMANAQYQQGYADSATTKANLANQYDANINNANTAIVAHKDAVAKQKADEAAAKVAAQQKRDEYLTKSTGVVYNNGKVLKHKNGKLVTTLEYQKMTEAQRHNIAVENNTRYNSQLNYKAKIDANNAKRYGDQLDYSVGMDSNNAKRYGDQLDYNSAIDANNARRQGDQLDYNARIDANNAKRAGDQLDYSLGMDKNAVARQKIAADASKAAARLKFDYANLDLKSQVAQANINNAKAKLDIIARDSSTKAEAVKAREISKQLDVVQKAINARIKAGKKPTSEQKKQLSKLQQRMESLVTGIANSVKKSGNLYGGSKSSSGFGGYRNYGKQPKVFEQHLSAAIRKGVPFSWAKDLTELVGRESSWQSGARNPTSTAHGYAQFLNSTERNYKKRYPGLNYNNPVDQLVLMYHYVKDTYGTPANALRKWESRSPHWY